jgi:mannosyltransferase
MPVFHTIGLRRIAVLGPLFAVVGTMWLFRLSSESFWFDEAFSARLASLGTADFVEQVTSGEGNMILYHLLLRATIPLCSTDTCLRSFSVLLMLGALFVSYLLYLRLTGKRIAILAVVFLAFNGFAFNYAREVRGYALALFLVLLSTLFFVRAVDEPGSKRYWIAYAVTAALSVYTHFYAASMLLVHASSLLGLPRERRPWRSLTLTWVATGIMLTPIFVYLAVSPAVGPRTARPTLRDLASLFARLLGGSAVAPYWFLPALILGPLFLWGIVNLAREVVKGPRSVETWHKALLLAWSTIPATIAFGGSQLIPLFHPKYMVWMLPAVVLVSVEGIVAIRHRTVMFALAAIAILFSLRSTLLCYSHCEIQDWRSVASYVVEQSNPGDGVVFERNFGRIGFDHYASIIGAPDATPLMPDEPWTYRGLEFGGTGTPTTTEILELVSAFDNVWLVLSMQIVDRSDSITTALESVYGAPQMHEFNGVDILFYSREH